jgi:hypothetical protein
MYLRIGWDVSYNIIFSVCLNGDSKVKSAGFFTITNYPRILYLQKGSRGISDIPPGRPRFTKLTVKWFW